VVEYVEFLLVAAILFLGIRAFVLQPFKIPTNSMWPSFYGMTADIFTEKEDEPGVLGKGFRFLALGAKSKRVDAPADGEVRFRIWRQASGWQLFRTVPARRWLVLPSTAKEYTFEVGNQVQTVKVPLDFDFDRTLSEAWFGDPEEWTRVVGTQLRHAEAQWKRRSAQGQRDSWVAIPTGREVKQGERILSFDILTGDQLFVDRMSYHFVKPSVGSGFVFRTRNIPKLSQRGKADDKYYIKRLVGTPGDVLEIRGPVLYRNGEPITGSRAFEYNANEEKRYRGYHARDLLAPGETVSIPDRSFFAMGDNSYNSLDSRYWGYVPADDVVGRPLFIYYPFTRRWGPSR
jgi:signal peptidase I